MFFLTKDYKYYFSIPYTTSEDINKYEKQTCFEIDELIFPIIQLLNQKGYTTTYSCAGHYFKNNIEDIIYDWHNIECSEVKFTDTSNKSIDESWSTPYIMFKYGINFSNLDTLPKRWSIQYIPKSLSDRIKLGNKVINITDPDYDYTLCLHYNLTFIIEKIKENNEIDIYKFYYELIKELKKLYIWVKSLPENKIKEG